MLDEIAQQTPVVKGSGFWSRLNHPLLGAFVGSWLLCNWDIVYLLIRGLPATTETVKEITEKYLVAERLGHLFWYPLWASLGFFFLGPVIENLHDLYKNKVAALIGRFESVNKWQYDQEVRQKRQAEEQRDIYQRVASVTNRMIPNGHGGTIALDQLVISHESLMKQLQEIQKENDRLKADKLTLELQLTKK